MPTGINAASIGVSCIYISGGTGTAEAPLITGWSATTITFTCVYTHTGAWTIQSASAGIQEAIIALGPTARDSLSLVDQSARSMALSAYRTP